MVDDFGGDVVGHEVVCHSGEALVVLRGAVAGDAFFAKAAIHFGVTVEVVLERMGYYGALRDNLYMLRQCLLDAWQ